MILRIFEILLSRKKKPRIRRHRQGLSYDISDEVRQFSSVEELFNIEWVKQFRLRTTGRFDPSFHQYSIEVRDGAISLIAEYDQGYEWSVIGHMYDAAHIVNTIPKWEPKFKGKPPQPPKDREMY